jgi:hypothetical protein
LLAASLGYSTAWDQLGKVNWFSRRLVSRTVWEMSLRVVIPRMRSDKSQPMICLATNFFEYGLLRRFRDGHSSVFRAQARRHSSPPRASCFHCLWALSSRRFAGWWLLLGARGIGADGFHHNDAIYQNIQQILIHSKIPLPLSPIISINLDLTRFRIELHSFIISTLLKNHTYLSQFPIPTGYHSFSSQVPTMCRCEETTFRMCTFYLVSFTLVLKSFLP